MKRIKMVLLFVLLLSFNSFLYAYEKEDSVESFKSFVDCYNNGDKEIIKYIDLNNDSLYKQIKKEYGKGTISYNEKIGIIDISETEYKLAVLMEGSGRIYNSEWAVKNKYIYFTFKYSEKEKMFLLTETDFFDASGINMIRKEYSKLFFKSLIIASIIFVFLLTIIFVISRRIEKNCFKINKEPLNN